MRDPVAPLSGNFLSGTLSELKLYSPRTCHLIGFLDGELQHGGGGEKLLQLPDISTDSEKEKCDSIDQLDAGLSKKGRKAEQKKEKGNKISQLLV